MSDKTKIVINGEVVAPGKKVRLKDHGIDSNDLVRRVREERVAEAAEITEAVEKEKTDE